MKANLSLILLLAISALPYGCTPSPGFQPDSTSTHETSEALLTILTPDLRSQTPTNAAIISTSPIEPPAEVVGARVYLPFAPWSLDDNWVMYWALTREQVLLQDAYAPASLYYLNSGTGEMCASSISSPYMHSGSQYPATWLSSGEALIISSERVFIADPCGENASDITQRFPASPTGIVAVNQDYTLLVMDSNSGILLYDVNEGTVKVIKDFRPGSRAGYSWSPDQDKLSIAAPLPDTGQEGNPFIATTVIIDTRVGTISSDVQWEYSEVEGNLPAPYWINDDQVIIGQTSDRGPLLLGTNGERVSVAQEFFDTNISCPEDCLSIQAKGIFSLHGATIALLRPGNVDIYSFPTDLVQSFRPYDSVDFSPDGNWYSLRASNGQELIAPTANLEAQVPIGINRFPSPIWSHDSQHFVTASSTSLTLFVANGGIELYSWDLNYNPFSAVWSHHDNAILLLAGRQEDLVLLILPSGK